MPLANLKAITDDVTLTLPYISFEISSPCTNKWTHAHGFIMLPPRRPHVMARVARLQLFLVSLSVLHIRWSSSNLILCLWLLSIWFIFLLSLWTAFKKCQGIGNLMQVSMPSGRHGALMISVLVSRSSGPGSSPGPGHCVVVLGKALNTHSASLHPGV